MATREPNETVRNPDDGRRTARRRRQLGLFVAAGLVAAALGLAAHASGALERLDLSSYDARLSIGGPSASLDRLVVVAIDEETQRELRRAFPFSRRFHAQAIDRLRAAGPRAIAYDIQFTEPKSEAEDLPLFDAVARTKGRIVLATAEVGPRGETSVLGGEPVLRDLGVAAADSNLPFDSDGVIRRMAYAPHGLKTLAVRTAEMAGGRPVEREQFEGEDPWINFQGAPGTVKTVSFADLLARRVPEAELRDKVVVVGATDRVIQDVHRTAASGSELMAGPEIQANAMATALDGFPLGRGTGGLAPVLILVMAAVGPLAAAALAPTRMLLACVAALIAFLVAAQLAFNAGTVLAVAAPLLALVAGTGGSFAVKYFTEIRERRRMRQLFGRFVPDQVVEQAMDRSPGQLREASRLDATVLFSDLRGFTSFSEALPAEQVTDVLNRYLTEMSTAIAANGGTVVSYMGDGIMAVFGAPIPAADHADRALAAAREMLARLERFNAEIREDGLGDGFRMGVGLNSGPVMSGNVGSEDRLEYTAIGDTTNTAARLEAMTKEAGCSVLVADSTKQRLRETPEDLVAVGDTAVRGRRDTVRLWSLD